MSVFIHVFKGLIVAADSISTPYSYNECNYFFMAPNFKLCMDWKAVEVESAPVVPPFIYNNQCASVLLTSYIPVLILGYSIQIVLSVAMPVLLSPLGAWLATTFHGILWPEYWLRDGDGDAAVASRNRVYLAKNPTIILRPEDVLCFNILNNLLIMLTFGLCSPVLAVAVTCAVVSKMSVLMFLVGRFSKVLRGGDDEDGSVHYALVALASVRFPLLEVLQQSFWVIVWTSALFVAMVCWDIAGDDVGWAASIWLPVTVICYPMFLWVVTLFRATTVQDTAACENNDHEVPTGDTELVPLPQNKETHNIANPLHLST
jgi:hypothetical protein